MLESALALGAAAWLLTYTLHSTVLLGAAWVGLRIAGRGSLRVRDAVWKLALVGGLVTSGLQLGLGLEPFGGRLVLRAAPPAAAHEREPSPPPREPRLDAAPSAPSPAPPAPAARDAGERAREEVPFPAHLVRRAEPPRREQEPVPGAIARVGGPEPVDREPERSDREPERSDLEPDRSDREPAQGDRQPARSDREPEQGDREPEQGDREPARSDREPAQRDRAEGRARARFAGVPAVVAPEGSPPRGAAPAAPPSAAAVPAGLRAALERLPRWHAALSLAWMAGGLVGLALLGVALVRLRRGLSQRFEIVRGPVHELFVDLQRRAGLRRRVRLWCSTELCAPITFGVLRPQVCLPLRALSRLTRGQQEAMLAHELAHAVRRDPAWLVACRALERLFFFQPLNRVARRELQEVAEYLSDEWAAARIGGGLPLASCLTEIASWLVGRSRDVPAPAMATRGSQLGERVERLLERGPSSEPERRRPWLVPLAAGALAGVALVVPGVAASGRAPLEAVPAAPPTAAPSAGVGGGAADGGRALGAELASTSEPLPADGAPACRPEVVADAARAPEGRVEHDAVPPSSTGTTETTETTTDDGLDRTLASLDAEIASLEREVDALREALARLAAEPELRAGLVSIEHRAARLRARREKLAELLPLVLRLTESEPRALDPSDARE